MTTELLNYFIITAKHLSFSAAAKELYVTQPAVSHQITELEKELGTTLFHRSTRKVSLTKAGELFLEDAKRMLDMEKLAKEKVSLLSDSTDEVLRIGYLLQPSHSFLPTLLKEFRNQYPQVTLSLIRMDAHSISDELDSPQCDLYFSMAKDFDMKGKSYRTLFNDTLCLVCNESHPCISSSEIDFDKLASETFLMLNPKIGPYMTQETQLVCRANNITPRKIVHMDTMEEIMFSIEAGMGVTILPAKNQSMFHTNLAFIPLSGAHTVLSFGVSWNPENDNPAIGWFLRYLEEFRSIHPELFS